MDNDGYVFNSGLSPTKKSSIIANVTDMSGDYGTTSAAARKLIENSLIKVAILTLVQVNLLFSKRVHLWIIGYYCETT